MRRQLSNLKCGDARTQATANKAACTSAGCSVARKALTVQAAQFPNAFIPFLGHEINAEVMALVVERMTGHIPKHHWDEVIKAAPK